MSTANQRRATGKWPKRPCIVCGARVTNLNPATVTCDSLCTRALKAGRDRNAQAIWEATQPCTCQDGPCAGWRMTGVCDSR